MKTDSEIEAELREKLSGLRGAWDGAALEAVQAVLELQRRGAELTCAEAGVMASSDPRWACGYLAGVMETQRVLRKAWEEQNGKGV